MSEIDIKTIHDFFPMSRCSRGTVFFRAGDGSDRLYILKEGTVLLYRLTREGKRIVVGTVRPGTVFGELALTGLTMRDCFAEAQEDSLVCVASRTDVEQMIRTHPSIGFRFIEVLGRRVLELEQRVEELASRTVTGRVASVLLRLAEDTPDGRLILGYSHDDIADTAGAARQTVSTTLRELEETGVVVLGRKKVEVIDRPRLIEMAAF
ncbi:MAG: Crp/Fnr family transcriptional regulator [Spirochaetaceae bacterium]|nr:Crp/Fnr family transcriptional regulator [Spirochaetaceae bacterium]